MRGIVALLLGSFTCSWTTTDRLAYAHGPQVRVADIHDAWRRREETIRSGSFTWEETVFIPKHSKPVIRRGQSWAVPPQDVTTSATARIVFNGDRIRFERTAPQWSVEKNAYGTRRYTSVFDGESSMSLFDKGTLDTRANGVIDAQAPYRDRDTWLLWPLLRAYRGTGETYGVTHTGQWEIVGNRPRAEGELCHLVRRSLDGEQKNALLVDEYLVAPEKDYSIVECTRAIRGIVIHELRVDYTREEGYGWVPTRWAGHLYRSTGDADVRRLTKSVEGTVVQFALNEAIPDEQFTLEFPPGAVIRDNREAQGDRTVVTNDGSTVIVSAQERMALPTRDEVLAFANEKRGWAMSDLFTYGTVGLIAVLLTLAVYLWTRRARAGR